MLTWHYIVKSILRPMNSFWNEIAMYKHVNHWNSHEKDLIHYQVSERLPARFIRIAKTDSLHILYLIITAPSNISPKGCFFSNGTSFLYVNNHDVSKTLYFNSIEFYAELNLVHFKTLIIALTLLFTLSILSTHEIFIPLLCIILNLKCLHQTFRHNCFIII
jgi:hypothetical protein